MKLKNFKAILLGVIFSSLFCKVTCADVVTVPAIEGQVIDATTGKPIKNAIVICCWAGTKPVFHNWHIYRNGEAFGKQWVRTDSNGYFCFVPYPLHKWPLNGIYKRFGVVYIEEVIHPYYIWENSPAHYYASWDDEDIEYLLKGETVYKPKKRPEWVKKIYGDTKRISGKYENGKIKYDIYLISVEEAFKLKPWNIPFKGSSRIDLIDILIKNTRCIRSYNEIWAYKTRRWVKGIQISKEEYLKYLDRIGKVINNYNDDILWSIWQKEAEEGIIRETVDHSRIVKGKCVSQQIYRKWDKKRFLKNYSKEYILVAFKKIREKIEHGSPDNFREWQYDGLGKIFKQANGKQQIKH